MKLVGVNQCRVHQVYSRQEPDTLSGAGRSMSSSHQEGTERDPSARDPVTVDTSTVNPPLKLTEEQAKQVFQLSTQNSVWPTFTGVLQISGQREVNWFASRT